MKFKAILIVGLLLIATSCFGSVTNYYIDGNSGADGNTGLSWVQAKATIWAAFVQAATDFDGSTTKRATFNISGGTSGITYYETHNLVIEPDSAGTIYGVAANKGLEAEGTIDESWIVLGSADTGRNGQVRISQRDISTYSTSNTTIFSNRDHTKIKNIKFTPDTTSNYDSIILSGTYAPLVENCHIDYNSHGIIFYGCTHSIARYNYFKGQNLATSSTAIKGTNTCVDMQLYFNILDKPGNTDSAWHFGIELKDSKDVRIFNNTIYRAMRIGIGVWDSCCDGLVIKNNIIVESGDATSGYDILIDNNTTDYVIDYNLIYNTNRNTIAYLGGTLNITTGPTGGTSYTWSAWQTAGNDIHGINANPKLSNPENHVFTINLSSPAASAGRYLGLTTDYAGSLLPNSSGTVATETEYSLGDIITTAMEGTYGNKEYVRGNQFTTGATGGVLRRLGVWGGTSDADKDSLFKLGIYPTAAGDPSGQTLKTYALGAFEPGATDRAYEVTAIHEITLVGNTPYFIGVIVQDSNDTYGFDSSSSGDTAWSLAGTTFGGEFQPTAGSYSDTANWHFGVWGIYAEIDYGQGYDIGAYRASNQRHGGLSLRLNLGL